MWLKALLVGMALAFVGAAPAFALVDEDELNGASEYVRVCDLYGAGYFYIPGTDTCLKVGGYVRFDARADTDYGGSTGRWDFQTGYGLKFQTRSLTEYGTLRSYAEIGGDTTDHVPGTNGLSGFDILKAYIAFGGFTAGYKDSLMDPCDGYTLFDDYISAFVVNQIRYQWRVTEEVRATLSIEDPRTRWGNYLPIDYSMPDIVGKIGVEQAWGRFNVSVGASQLSGGAAWGAKAEATIKLDMLGPGDRLHFVVGYAYDGGKWIGGDGVAAGNWTSGLVSGKFYVANNLYLAATASAIDGPGTSYDRWNVSGGLHWKPVTGLSLGADVGYDNHQGASILFSAERKWGGSMRND